MVCFSLIIFNNHWSGAYCLGNRYTNLNDVDFIREELKINLPVSRIASEVEEKKRKSVQIDISEELARKSELFCEHNPVYVNVPDKYLNQFCKQMVITDIDKETGEILKAEISFSFQEDEFLSHWEENCFFTSK